MNEQTQAKPAPGPWLNWTNEIVDANHIEVCEIYARAEDEGMRRSWTANANARLIAAAPDLLESVEMLVKAVENLLPGARHIVADIGLINNALVASKRAIAKAKGK